MTENNIENATPGRSEALQARLPSLRGHIANVGSSFAHKIVAMASSMIVTALATREFGLAGLALIVLASQVASYAQLVELGIPSAMSRRLPRAIGDSDEDTIRSICTVAFVILLSGSLLILLATPFIALSLPRFLVLSDEQRSTASALFTITLVIMAVQLPLRIGFGILSSLHRFSTYFSIELLASLAKTALAVFILFLAEPPLTVFVAATMLPFVVAAAYEYRSARRGLPAWKLRLKDIRRRVLQDLTALSGAVMIGTLASTLAMYGGGIGLAFFVAPEEVATFSVPVFLAFSLMAFSASASAFISPVASQLTGRDEVRLRNAVQLSSRYAFALATLIWLGSLAIGPLVLKLWLGAEAMTGAVHEQMSRILVIASAGMALAVPGGICRGALVAMGRHWAVARIELTTAVLGLSLAVAMALLNVLVPVTCFVLGLFATVVIRGVALLMLAFKAEILAFGESLRDWGRVVAVAASGLLTFTVIRVAVGEQLLIATILAAFASLSAALLVALFCVLSSSHRKLLLVRFGIARADSLYSGS